MNENIGLFLKKVSEDTALQEKFKAIKEPDASYALASSIQEGFTKEEFIAVLTQGKQIAEGGELTDEDLANASGGWDWARFGIMAGAGVVTTGVGFGAVIAVVGSV